jgi:hypothetical protein
MRAPARDEPEGLMLTQGSIVRAFRALATVYLLLSAARLG